LRFDGKTSGADAVRHLTIDKALNGPFSAASFQHIVKSIMDFQFQHGKYARNCGRVITPIEQKIGCFTRYLSSCKTIFFWFNFSKLVRFFLQIAPI